MAIACLLNAAVFFTSLYNQAVTDPEIWIGIGFTAALSVAVFLGFISIFLFRNRTRQIQWVKAAIFFQMIFLGFGTGILFSMGGISGYTLGHAPGVFFQLLSLCLLWLAARSIKKDEKLVQSMDRIR